MPPPPRPDARKDAGYIFRSRSSQCNRSPPLSYPGGPSRSRQPHLAQAYPLGGSLLWRTRSGHHAALLSRVLAGEEVAEAEVVEVEEHKSQWPTLCSTEK